MFRNQRISSAQPKGSPSLRFALGLLVVAVGLCANLARAEVSQAQLASLKLPAGFEIELLTDQVPNARQMALSNQGTLFVGTRRKGNLYAIPKALASPKQAGASRSKSRPVVVLAEGLTLPSGLTMHGEDLLVGAVNRILRFVDIDQHLAPDAPFEVITDQLPTERHHGWKYLRMGPDDHLYVPVGAPCNICKSKDPRFASILRMDPTTGATTVYAAGVRNTVGLAWHPDTQQLWFSENGRDLLGDDIPPEEINRVSTAGQHFGYPYVHAGTLPDPEFGQGVDPKGYEPPMASFQAHSAPLGITFYQGEQFPPRYRKRLFIAEHGSWNRSKKVGYRVSLLTPDGASEVEPFITGWLVDEDSWGRPNDVLMAPDGSLLISDDKAGAIYRVRYNPAS